MEPQAAWRRPPSRPLPGEPAWLSPADAPWARVPGAGVRGTPAQVSQELEEEGVEEEGAAGWTVTEETECVGLRC